MKEYKELKNKYDIPAYKDINKDFLISTIEEEEEFYSREIAKKMDEKIEFFANILEEILSPDTKLSSLHESNLFNENEKKDILRIYRKLIYNNRKYTFLEISYDEEQTAKYVKEFYEEWQDIKPELKKIFNRIKSSWTHDKKTKLELSYFG